MNTQKELVEQYISQMTPLERQAYDIARSHLGTSFSIVKSNGFKEFVKNYLNKNQNPSTQNP